MLVYSGTTALKNTYNMKIIFILCLLYLPLYATSQPQQISIRNDSIYIDEAPVPQPIPSKDFIDGLMQSKSRTGIITGMLDPVSGESISKKQRAYHYPLLGLYFYSTLKDRTENSMSIVLSHEAGQLSKRNQNKSSVYNGGLLIGEHALTKETTLQDLQKSNSISIVGSGETRKTKVPLTYALARYGNLLIRCYFKKTDGRLTSVTVMQ